MPAHRLADRLPDAVHPRPADPRADDPRPGRQRRRRDRADRARERRRYPRLGHRALGGEARARAGARRRRRLRARRAPARARRRRDGDDRRRDLESLDPSAQTRRHDRDLRGDHRRRPPGRAHPDLLPAAVGRRLDDGHPRRARTADSLLRRPRHPPDDRQTLPLAEAREGFAAMLAGDLRGKIVFTV